MFRTIIDLGPISIHSYGLMLAIAFFSSVWFVKKRCPSEKLPFEKMLSVAYLLIFGGIIGGRLGYVLLHMSDFSDNLLSSINPFQGDRFGIAGLNLYGGILLAVLAAILYLKIKKLPLLAVVDLFAPTLGLGIGIARIGCFLNGCCFGTPTDLPWGVTFPEHTIPYSVFGAIAVHPAQLYTSGYGLLLFFILYRILKNKKFDGQVLAVLFMLESVFRFLIEYVRYYESEMKFTLMGTEPTYNQVVSLVLFTAGLVLYLRAPRVLLREMPSNRKSQIEKA